MKPTASRLIIGGIVAVILLMGTCSAGFIAGRMVAPRALSPVSLLPNFSQPTAAISKQGTPSGEAKDTTQLFAPFWQAWDLVHQQYVDQPVNEEALMRGAIDGMLKALGDDHTSYMDPTTQEQVDTQLKGEYEGIGAVVDTTTEFLTVVSVYPKSPAEKANLQSGDQVVAVNGEGVSGMDPELVRRKVIGPAGSQVTLTIRRKGVEKDFEVIVTRAKINLPSVESKMLKGDIGYVRLYNFGENTAKDLHTELQNIMAQKPAGLVLDLRGNGGGYLTTGIDVGSEFIDQGTIVQEQYGDGKRDIYNAKKGGLATKVPLVVLVDEGSASASEIVAGAIQDTGRGKLVGVTTYGKGSVQIWTDLVDNEGAVRITVARWLTPKGRTIHKVGLKPDVEVQLTAEDIKAGRDPQLDKAVELLTQSK